VRKLATTVIAVARVLPLADRTVVAAGTMLGHLVFWDADGPALEPRLCQPYGTRGASDGVFMYHPHTGSVGGITAHPSAPRKVMPTSSIPLAWLVMCSGACSVHVCSMTTLLPEM